MKPLSLDRVRAALIIAPHPDDETIGAFGLIGALKARGARVRVLVVTDGAASHKATASWPTGRLVTARKRESRRAMRALGIGAAEVTFLGLADGALHTHRNQVWRSLQRAVSCFRGLDLIVLPSGDDDHPDHRAVAGALARTAVPRLHYLVWPQRPRPEQMTHFLRLGIKAATKRGVIQGYRTQMGAIVDDLEGFAISRARLAHFARPVEHFRKMQR